MVSLLNSTVTIALCILLQILSCSGAPKTIGSFNAGPRIINGTLAERNATRHQASIRRKINDSIFFGTGHICGGSLITSSVVLSAAHCCVNYNSVEGEFLSALDFIVVMGNLDRFEKNENTLSYEVTHIVYGVPKFNLSTFETDIALFFLSKDVPANHPVVQPILINRKTLPGGTMCQVTGWGNTEQGYLSDLLMSVDVPIIPNAACVSDTQLDESEILDGMMCAGYPEGERDACSGDSGGPLVCGKVLTGIVSWGYGCALPDYPGVYADVAYYATWIQARIEEAGGSLPGSAPNCFRGSLSLLAILVILFKNYLCN